MNGNRRHDELMEQLALHFGLGSLPPDLQALVDTDPESARVWAELQSLSDTIEVDRDDVFSDVELETACRRIDDRIADRPQRVVVPLHWLRTMTRVAAAVLLVAVTYGSYRLGQNREIAKLDYTPPAATVVDMDGYSWTDMYTVDSAAAVAGSSVYAPSDSFVKTLLEDYTSRSYSGAGEQLLGGDLTDEEYQYLEKNLTVGDIL